MKIQIYTVHGDEVSYDFKSEIAFPSHIKNLYENLILHSEQIKKMIGTSQAQDLDISTHYGIQEYASAQWADNSSDPLISAENTLYFKLKPLTLYIQAVEKYLATLSVAGPVQSVHLLNQAIQQLYTHLALLMFEDKANIFISSSFIKVIVKLVFLYPTLQSLNLLVFFLSNSNSNSYEGAGAGHSGLNSSSSSASNSPKPKIRSNSESKRGVECSGESISLFTLVDSCVRECSRDYDRNFYLFLLEERQVLSTSSGPAFGPQATQQQQVRFEFTCQVLKVVNNMFRLSQNPIIYTTRLHLEGVFKRLIEIREREPKLATNPQYIVLRSNLMKELHTQRLQKVNPEKIQHQVMLSDVWAAAIPSHPYGGTHSSHWLSLGFRGPNPTDDFKVTGVLALRNLAYFARQYPTQFQHILMTQTKREDLTSQSSLTLSVGTDQQQSISPPSTPTNGTTPSRSYPLAVACVSLTYTLSNIFRIGRETSPDASLWDISLCDNNWFDECFITTVNLFESLWHSEAHSYSDFPQVISHARYIIEKVCSDSPKSVVEFKEKLNNIIDKKTPIDFEVSNELIARYHQLQPSHTSKRHIHKIFGERIDIDIVPNENEDSSNVNGTGTGDSEPTVKKGRSLSIEIPKNGFDEGSMIGDGPISPTNFSYKRLIKFFGERVNSRSVQFAPQPSNVKSYKLKNFFGEGPVVITRDEQPVPDTISDQQSEVSDSPQALMPMTERSHRLHVFFGEWFDTEQVEYNEKMRLSTSPEQTPPTSPTLSSQPEHTRLHKLNKFFGERVNIPISKSKIVGEGGGSGVFAIDDLESTTSSSMDLQLDPNEPNRSPEEARSDFKAQKLLGERLDIKKEKEALQFAPQPSHIREYKLHKLFGEMIPSSKLNEPWKKGSIINSKPGSAHSKNHPRPITQVIAASAPTSPRDGESLSIPVSPNSVASEPGLTTSTSLPTSPRLSIPIIPVPLTSGSTSPNDNTLLPSGEEEENLALTNTFGVNLNRTSTEALNPGSVRDSYTSGSENITLEEDEQQLIDQLDEDEEHKNNSIKNKKKNHRLHVFFGERFDVEGEGYHSRLSGSYSPNGPNSPMSTSLPNQPDTVKYFKLKKFFGKSPDTETNETSGTSSANSSELMKPSESDEDLLENLSTSSSSPNIKSTIHKFTQKQQQRRDFKAQKILGERIDVKREKEYSNFKDQPSTVKVDKLIGLFGEKVAFSLKRKDSMPNLSRSASVSQIKQTNPNPLN